MAPRATSTRGGWSIARAMRLCRRASATTRCTASRVTRATAPVRNDVSDAVTVRPMIEPMATATAKSNAPSWASVRRSPSRRPTTATANNRTALATTQPSPPAPPMSSDMRRLPGAGGVTFDQLVGDGVEVLADVVRLRADRERCVALAQDEPGLPAGRARPDRVPDVACDQADVAGVEVERGRYRLVRLRRGLVTVHGLVDAEPALDLVDDAALGQLPP